MNKARDLFTSITIDGQNINLETLENNQGKISLGAENANKHVAVTFELKNKTTIPANLFKDIEQLKSISLPNTITTIEDNAFEGSGITSINLDSVTYVGKDVFKDTNVSESANSYFYTSEEAAQYNGELTGAISIDTEKISEYYSFTSYGDSTKNVTYGTGIVQVTGVTKNGAVVKVVENNPEDTNAANFVGQSFKVNSLDETATLQLYSTDDVEQNIWVTVNKLQTYSFTSYGDSAKNVKYGDGKVVVTDMRAGGATVKVVENNPVDTNAANFVGQSFNVALATGTNNDILQLSNLDNTLIDIWVTVAEEKYITYSKEEVDAHNAELEGAVKEGDRKK